MGDDGHTTVLQIMVGFFVRLQGLSLHVLDIEDKEGQVTLFCHRSIQLAQRARRAVAWVSKGLFPQ